MPRSFTPTRQFAATGIGNFQQIHDTKYCTRALAAAAIPTTTNFFGAAPSSDATLDRYEQGNTLVSSAKIFTIVGILMHVWSGAGAVLTDWELLIQRCCLRIVTNQKEFGVFPCHMVPGGGGLAIQSGQVAVTPTASPGALSTIGAVNGMPARSSGFTLAEPLDVQANQPFYMELLGPVTTPATLTGILNVKIILDGLEKRTAS